MDERSVYVMFCDDIRMEVGNKHSLMGVYHGDIIISQKPPVRLQKLCIVTCASFAFDEVPTKLVVSVRRSSDNKQIAQLAVDPQNFKAPTDDAKKVTIEVGMQVVPIEYSTDEFIEVWVAADDKEVRGGRLKVRFELGDAEKVDS